MENQAKNIYQRICAVMSEVSAVGKNKKNPQQGYAYRGIDDFYNILHPLFAKHGVFITHDILEQNTVVEAQKDKTIYRVCLKITYTFHAADGSSVSCTTYSESLDFGDKAVGKALSYGLKYVLMQMFLIPTEEKDNDAYSTEYEAIEAIKEKIQACKTIEELNALYTQNKHLADKLLPFFSEQKRYLLNKR